MRINSLPIANNAAATTIPVVIRRNKSLGIRGSRNIDITYPTSTAGSRVTPIANVSIVIIPVAIKEAVPRMSVIR